MLRHILCQWNKIYMLYKSILIGTFVKKKKILSFIETLKNDFNVLFKNIFIYNIENNTKEFLVTYKVNDRSFLTKVDNSTILHVKCGCLFSINALNELINSDKNNSNKSNKDVLINWSNYKDKLIILTNKQLNINKICKIEDKCIFLTD